MTLPFFRFLKLNGCYRSIYEARHHMHFRIVKLETQLLLICLYYGLCLLNRDVLVYPYVYV